MSKIIQKILEAVDKGLVLPSQVMGEDSELIGNAHERVTIEGHKLFS